MGNMYRLLRSMLANENNRENHPILNPIYDILTELPNQGKQLTLCKVPAHIGVKGNATKQAIDIPGMTTTRLPNTNYYLTIRRARNSKWQREWENSTSKLHYIKPCIGEWKSAYNSCRQYEVKLSKIWIGNSQLTHGHLMSEMNHQNLQKCSMWKINTNNKTLPTRLPPMEGQQKEIQYPE